MHSHSPATRTATCQQTQIEAKLSRRPRRSLFLSAYMGLWALSGLLSVEAQCLPPMMSTFERVSNVAVKDAVLAHLYTAANASAALGLLPSFDRQMAEALAAGALNVPITAECNNRCRKSSKCRGFLVDYARHTCFSIEQPPAGLSSLGVGSSGMMRNSLLSQQAPVTLVPTLERTSYFEKVCLGPTNQSCERAWAFERVPGHQIQGHDDKLYDDIDSRLRCQELCLQERDFRCRSGEYDYTRRQCRLSLVDRHLKQAAFRPTPNNVDYFENQCAPVGHQCDAFDRFEDLDLGRAEIMRPANSSDQCQQICTQVIKAFVCRSFTWNPLTRSCHLNSANTFTAGGLDKLLAAPGLTYFQRNDCVDLKLDCDTMAMTLSLRTMEPFKGRMYVRDEPNGCEVVGRSSLSSTLSIPFQQNGARARCATREPPNRYSSVVVVQQHPVIQRKSDRYIKLVCDFQTANKTIQSSYNVVANPWTSTALINATSFAPQIKLRITDKFGVDITGAKLGDELYLRIEAESDSVYDMVARSVLAKSGQTDESVLLIDKDGCPTDYRIFPPLRKLNRRTILGKFDAFKFSSDVVVRFQVDVQFCLNQCPPSSCESAGLSQLMNSNSQLDGDAFELQPGESPTQQPNSGLAAPAAPTNRQSVSHQLHGQHLASPVPFAIQDQGPLSSSSSSSGQTQRPLNFSQVEPPYGGASPSATPLGGFFYSPDRLPGGPANSPAGQSASAASHLPAGESQTFDGPASRPAAAPTQSAAPAEPKTLNGELGQLPARHHPGRQARRRRSAEPMPKAPSHVPLQHEIIVLEAPASSQQPAAGGRRGKSGRRPDTPTSMMDTNKMANRNGPSDPTSQQRAQHQQKDPYQQDDGSASLVCTTRQSLVIAILLFSTIQLLTISMCLVAWINRLRPSPAAKFKVGPQSIGERLY